MRRRMPAARTRNTPVWRRKRSASSEEKPPCDKDLEIHGLALRPRGRPFFCSTTSETMKTTGEARSAKRKAASRPRTGLASGLPVKQGLYDPWFEHDACGVG